MGITNNFFAAQLQPIIIKNARVFRIRLANILDFAFVGFPNSVRYTNDIIDNISIAWIKTR